MSLTITAQGQTYSLGQKEYLGAGGEGSVYVKNGNAIKIYLDIAKLIPAGKIQELSTLDHPRIIKPLALAFDAHTKKPCGYVMSFAHGSPLCQIFTRSFRERNGITPDMVLSLTRDLRELVKHAHERDVLIVDLNEMNFLVDARFRELYAIDVDSWQTRNYPATALMESIRDRHCNGHFTEGSDWFSYAVVSFQMLVGIHPYRGRHPKYKGLDDRMKLNLSVFNSEVSVPASCYPVDSIPPKYRDWYREVFENAERCEPPFEVSGMLFVPVSYKTGAAVSLELNEVFKTTFPLSWYVAHAGKELFGGANGFTDRHDEFTAPTPQHGIVFRGAHPYGVYRDAKGKVVLKSLCTQIIPVFGMLDAEDGMVYDGTLYYRNAGYLFRCDMTGAESKPIASPVSLGEVLDNAQFFPGVVVQNMLGTYYASTFPLQGHMVQTKLPFPQGSRIVEAMFSRGVLVTITESKGVYDRHICVIAPNGTLLKTRTVKDVPLSGVNFIVLDKGLVITITETEELELFHKDDPNTVRTIKDPAIHGGMRLYTDGGACYYLDGNSLMSIKMK